MQLPNRMEVEQRMACPHCRKMLPEFADQEIAECEEYPLRCAECRRVVPMPAQLVAAAKQRMRQP